MTCLMAFTWFQFLQVVGASAIGYLIGRGGLLAAKWGMAQVRRRNGHP